MFDPQERNGGPKPIANATSAATQQPAASARHEGGDAETKAAPPAPPAPLSLGLDRRR